LDEVCKERLMSNDTPSPPPSGTPAGEDHAIRERTRELTAQLLQQGQIDPERVREVVRALTTTENSEPAPSAEAVRQGFADAIRQLDEVLLTSSRNAHAALEKLVARGKDFTDNDIKDALASLMTLQQDCLAATTRIADAAQANFRLEVGELAAQAQTVGAEASARLAATINDLSNRIGEMYRRTAAPGLDTARTYSVRMALMASGVLAGVADALARPPGTKTK
jgi:hypothetical protein